MVSSFFLEQKPIHVSHYYLLFFHHLPILPPTPYKGLIIQLLLQVLVTPEIYTQVKWYDDNHIQLLYSSQYYYLYLLSTPYF